MESTTVDREQIDAEHRRQEFEAEAGEAVGPMPHGATQDAPPLEELRVDGTTQLSAFDFGGKRATSATVTLGGGAIELTDGTAYEKGTTIKGTFTAIVREVKQRDKVDGKTGIIVSCKQGHWAEVVDLTVES